MKVFLSVLIGLVVCVFLSVHAQAELVGYWSFDDVDGKIIKDSSGSGNDGTLMETAKVVKDGISGSALSLDGASYVEVPSHASLENQEFTISFWMKTDDCAAKTNGGISKGQIFGGKPSYDYQLSFYKGLASFGISNYINSSWKGATCPIPDNNWHLWTGVVSPKNVRLYVDTILIPTGNRGRGWGKKYANELIMDYGKHYNFYIGGDRYQLKGLMDEVRIYNTALTGKEIEQYYASVKSKSALF